MGLKKMEVIFDNNGSDTFYAGSEVLCQLILSLDAPKKVREISIKFKGKGQVCWVHHDGRNMEFTAEELYFENKFNLAEEMNIPAGEHNLNFSSYLPANLPSSFESDYGYIRYTVKVVLRRPRKFNHKCKARFNVVCPLDLNYSQKAKTPLYIEKQKVVGVPFCKSGPVSVTVSAPYSGFTPGQNIPATIEIDNGTNTDVTDCLCVLIKVVLYTAEKPHKLSRVEKVEVAKLAIGPIYANGSMMWDGDFAIPHFPPANTDSSNIIDISFQLKLKLVVAGIFNRNLHLSAPIVIGTVPLLSTQGSLVPQAELMLPSANWKIDDRRPTKPLCKKDKIHTADKVGRKYSDFSVARSAPSVFTAKEHLIKVAGHASSDSDVQL